MMQITVKCSERGNARSVLDWIKFLEMYLEVFPPIGIVMLDPNLLNKIQSIKTLRDRAGTEGEKDAAQHKLTLIMAKHKLTEQDIPNPDFSTRSRYYEYTPKPFNDRKEYRGYQNSKRKHTSSRKKPNQADRKRFEKSFGTPVTSDAWFIVLEAMRHSQKSRQPSNPNAFRRAFLENSALAIQARTKGLAVNRSQHTKSSNADGKASGLNFAERVDLSLFS